MPRRTHRADEKDIRPWDGRKCMALLMELHQGTAEPENSFYRDKKNEGSCVYARKKQSHAIH